MAGYIGSGASVVSSGAERKKVFDITTNTTSLTGLNYTVGKVHVYHNGVRLVDGTDYTATNSTSITLTVAAVSGDQVVVVSYASYQVALSGIDDQSNAVAIKIDSDENVLIGTADATPYDNTSGNGILLGDGLISSAQSGGNAAIFNRMTSDGSIVNFRKDGSTIGSIGVWNNDNISLYGNLTHAGIGCATNSVEPIRNNAPTDNSIDLGVSSARFKDAYLSGGVYLGGTGSANKLDDFETGTFTPSAGSNITINSVENATYTKVGRLITISIWLKVNITSANFVIGSLPFNAGNDRSTCSISDITNPQVISNQIAGLGIYGYGASTAGTSNDLFITASYPAS